MTKARSTTLRITLTAVFMALNIIMSSFGIPVPGGHLYLCDAVICLASILLNPFEAWEICFSTLFQCSYLLLRMVFKPL